MAKSKATTFSSRSNAKRAAEKAIEVGTAPSIDYGIKEHASGRFEILWHLRGDGSSTSAGDPQIATATAEAEVVDPFARIEASEKIEALGTTPEKYGFGDEAPEEERAPKETPAEPFPKGARVQVQIRKNQLRWGTIDYRVDANYFRVLIDGAVSASLFRVASMSLNDAPPPEPKGKPERKPRAAPSGDRKPSKSAELDAAAARGETPTKPVMTSKANPHYQARFDKLEAMAMADDWDGVRAYVVKGINSYAKMVAGYRDRLLAAHEVQQRKTEAAE